MALSIVVFVHILAGSFFAVNLIVMQIVVTGIMRRLPGGPVKKEIDDFLEVHWRPVLGVVVPLIWLTAGYLFFTRMSLFFGHPLYLAKSITGLYALSAVSFNHFYYRHKKRRLRFSKDPEDQKRFEKMKGFSHLLERSILFAAVTTAVLAVYAHHGPSF